MNCNIQKTVCVVPMAPTGLAALGVQGASKHGRGRGDIAGDLARLVVDLGHLGNIQQGGV